MPEPTPASWQAAPPICLSAPPRATFHLLCSLIPWLLFPLFAEAQSGLHLQTLDKGNFIYQSPEILKKERVKAIRFLPMSLKKSREDAEKLTVASRTFVLENELDDSSSAATVEIDSLTGKTGRTRVWNGNGTEDVVIYFYDVQGRDSLIYNGYRVYTDPFFRMVDSTSYTYDDQGHLSQTVQLHINRFGKPRRIVRHIRDASGALQETHFLTSKRPNGSKIYPEPTLEKALSYDTLWNANGQVIRTRQMQGEELFRMDSLRYVDDGRLRAHWQTGEGSADVPFFLVEDFRPDGKVRARQVQYPHYRKRRRIEFVYNAYGLLLEYHFRDDHNRAMVVELHYDFFEK
jgi:hypothetical protein